jgi:hypothetical protein
MEVALRDEEGRCWLTPTPGARLRAGLRGALTWGGWGAVFAAVIFVPELLGRAQERPALLSVTLGAAGAIAGAAALWGALRGALGVRAWEIDFARRRLRRHGYTILGRRRVSLEAPLWELRVLEQPGLVVQVGGAEVFVLAREGEGLEALRRRLAPPPPPPAGVSTPATPSTSGGGRRGR